MGWRELDPLTLAAGQGMVTGFTWDVLDEGKGVDSLQRMRERIVHYRREQLGVHEDRKIGCVYLRDVTFIPDSLACL